MMEKKKKRSEKPEPMHYWLVELALTSGKIHTFYVKARNHTEAQDKALSWEWIADFPKLMRNGFVLRP